MKYLTLYDVGMFETMCFIQTTNIETWFYECNEMAWIVLNRNSVHILLKNRLKKVK